MAYRPRTRTRIHPFPLLRAPDGSAFQKCKQCGKSVAIALYSMHKSECHVPHKNAPQKTYIVIDDDASYDLLEEHIKNEEKVVDIQKGKNEDKALDIQNKDKKIFDIQGQPRSAFCFFMESYSQICEATENLIEIDRMGFEKWKNMSLEERQPFVTKAEKVEAAYDKILQEEINKIPMVDDDADSAMVGKMDLNYEDMVSDESGDYEASLSYRSRRYKRLESYDTHDWESWNS